MWSPTATENNRTAVAIQRRVRVLIDGLAGIRTHEIRAE
jgi:hypothetical protein